MAHWRKYSEGDARSPRTIAQPTRCPRCDDRTVVTSDKVPTIDTYWRCVGCGEVWNDERRRHQARVGTHV